MDVAVDRPVAVVTLLLLQIFTFSAAAGVVKVTPERELTPQPAAVAARQIVVPGATTQSTAPGPVPAQAALTARLDALGVQGITGVVLDSETRETLFDVRSSQSAVPASTNKILTATAALSALGPDMRLTTKVVRKGDRIVLVGGGDPTLSSRASISSYPRPASIVDLAKKTATALKAAGISQVTVDYDTDLYKGSPMGPGWKPTYVTEGSVAPVAALMVDNGRVSPNPCEGTVAPSEDGPKAAASAFSSALQRFGINTDSGREASSSGGQQVAEVKSPTVAALVEHLMQCSDNDVAEAMARQVALKRKLPASFDGAAQAVRQVLQSLGVAQGVSVVDASGLSPLNRITPLALARIVALDASGPEMDLRTVITGMPVAGFSGTLSERFTDTAGAGLVRAKTGSLNNVATLAGVAYAADGRLLTFAFMANDVQDLSTARLGLDRLATTITTCGC